MGAENAYTGMSAGCNIKKSEFFFCYGMAILTDVLKQLQQCLFQDCLLCSNTEEKCFLYQHLSLVTRKPVFGVCDQLRHKPACAATETS